MRTNFHTHTFRCMHAEGDAADYAGRAIKAGYDVLGIADHCPWPYKDFVSPIRMTVGEFPEYLQAIDSAKAEVGGKLKLYKGIECEYFPEYMNFLREVKDGAFGKVDYLLLGQHNDLTEIDSLFFGSITDKSLVPRYIEQAIAGMRTGLYSCLVHPDLFLYKFETFDDDLRAASRRLCEAAADMNVPLEYNLYGLRKRTEIRRVHGLFKKVGLGYPNIYFWECAARAGCKAIIGVDAHELWHMDDPELYVGAEMTLAALGMDIVYSLVNDTEEALC
ncbi:MAG: histidinol-phosphatase [Oscillospiraceae bacterium]|nr:histidinol-phosphatase [Oscillospiraceae bacterium]